MFARLPRLPLWQPLAGADFRLLWLAQSLSLLGDAFLLVALAWLTLQLTGSGLALGAVLMTAAIPRTAFLLLGGALSDRLSPRALLVASGATRALLTGGLVALLLAHAAQLSYVYALAFAFGLADAFFAPARSALLVPVVPPQLLEAGNALMLVSENVMGLVGPAAAGLVVAAWGTTPAFAVDSTCFAATTVSVLLMRARGPNREVAARGVRVSATLQEIGAGLRHVWTDRPLRAVLLVMATINLAFMGPIGVGLPALARRQLGGAVALGTMLAAAAAGDLVGTLTAGAFRRRFPIGPVMTGVLLWLGGGLLFVGRAGNLALAAFVLFVMGLAGFGSVVSVAWVQRRAPEALQGRVMSLMLLSLVAMTPVSYLVAGALVDVSTMLLFDIAGGTLVAVGIVLTLTPGMRELWREKAGDMMGARAPNGQDV